MSGSFPPAGIAGALAGAGALAVDAAFPFAPFGLSRNWMRPPGTSRISVEKRSDASSSLR